MLVEEEQQEQQDRTGHPDLAVLRELQDLVELRDQAGHRVLQGHLDPVGLLE